MAITRPDSDEIQLSGTVDDVRSSRGVVREHVMDWESFSKNAHCHSQHHHSTRRKFLAAGSAACAATTFTMRGHAVAADGSKLIDTHHHFYPPTYQKAWADWEDQRKIPHFGVQLAWSRDQDIEEMDKDGVTTSILSLASTPGTWFDADARAAHDMARLCCDFARKWCATGPAVMAYSRRCRCSTSTPRLKRSNMRSIRSRPMVSICKRITETNGSAIRLTGRFSRS
jgi:hypothetical protein